MKADNVRNGFLGSYLFPLVSLGMRRLERSVSSEIWDRIDIAARSEFAAHLAHRIWTLIAPAVWSLNKAKAYAVDDSGKVARVTEVSTHADWQSGELPYRLLQDSPHFNTTILKAVGDWVDAQTRMLVHLHRDAINLARVTRSTVKTPHLTRVELGLSDFHSRSRAVAILELESRHRVVYKPRRSTGECIWFRGLSLMNENGFVPKFRIPWILNRRRYCWMECISKQPITEENSSRNFYFRWGAQTLIASYLEFADLHYENWIAFGDQPILVDAETYGHNSWRLRKRDAPTGVHLNPLLATGLVPLYAEDQVGTNAGIAPFGRRSQFQNVPAAWPHSAAVNYQPIDYVNDLVCGFEAAMIFFLKSKARTTKLNRLKDQVEASSDKRVFVRSTREYYHFLHDSLLLHHAVSRNSRQSFLEKKCVHSAPSFAIGLMEARILSRCSIPRFDARLLPNLTGTSTTNDFELMRELMRLLRERVVSVN